MSDRVRALYDGCYRRLVAQVYALTADVGEAQDAVQEAFVRALAEPRSFERVDNPEAWLRVVALNVARRRLRRRAHLDRLLRRPAASGSDHRALGGQPGPRPDLADAAADPVQLWDTAAAHRSAARPGRRRFPADRR